MTLKSFFKLFIPPIFIKIYQKCCDNKEQKNETEKIYTKIFVNEDSSNKSDLYILGNGPSLLDSIDTNIDLLKQSDVMVLNHFAKSKYYEEIKPKYYFFCDTLFFYPALHNNFVPNEIIDEKNESSRKTISNILKKTTWPMNLIIPKGSENSELLHQLKGNMNIKFCFYEDSVYKGVNEFNIWIQQQAHPPFYNVLVGAIYFGIILNYEKIFLFGTDHSFFKNVFVNENNQVIELLTHFYKEKRNDLVSTDPLGKPNSMADLFESNHNIWAMYKRLNDFAMEFNVKIFNCTENSYIDAFERYSNNYIEKEKNESI